LAEGPPGGDLRKWVVLAKVPRQNSARKKLEWCPPSSPFRKSFPKMTHFCLLQLVPIPCKALPLLVGVVIHVHFINTFGALTLSPALFQTLSARTDKVSDLIETAV
jgi:hypothetical protein